MTRADLIYCRRCGDPITEGGPGSCKCGGYEDETDGGDNEGPTPTCSNPRGHEDNGTGRDGQFSVCGRCKEQVRIYTDTITCFDCNGSGRGESYEPCCIFCDGHGEVSQDEIECGCDFEDLAYDRP